MATRDPLEPFQMELLVVPKCVGGTVPNGNGQEITLKFIV